MNHVDLKIASDLLNKSISLRDELILFDHWRRCKICRYNIELAIKKKTREKIEPKSKVFYTTTTMNDLQLYIYFTEQFIIALGINREILPMKDIIYLHKQEFIRYHERFIDTLNTYFEQGKPIIYKKAYPLFARTLFSKTVLHWTYLIPHGKTVSYSELAEWLGGHHYRRAIGQVLSHNKLPIIIPCHRVVQKSGNPGEFTAGRDIKKKLIELEQNYLKSKGIG